jgi:hypothetical protein
MTIRDAAFPVKLLKKIVPVKKMRIKIMPPINSHRQAITSATTHISAGMLCINRQIN